MVRPASLAAAVILLVLLISACQGTNSVATGLKTTNPVVRLSTELGNIDIELYAARAPKTVANFLAYVDAGLYAVNEKSTASFYRTVREDNQQQNELKISVLQGGLLGADMKPVSNSLPPIEHETTLATRIEHLDGVISLARLEPGSGSSEFFICVGAQPSLNYGGQRNPDGQGFAAFGKVVRGMNLVRQIHQAETVARQAGSASYTGGQIIQRPIQILGSQRLTQ